MGKVTRWVAAAAALAMAGAASAALPPDSRLAGLRVGAFAGYESADVSGATLRADGELPIRELSPLLRLSGVASLGYSRLSESIRYGALTSNLFKLVPSARLSAAITPKVALFGDLGLGLAVISARTEKTVPFFGTSTSSASSANLMMRLAAGASYHLSPQVDLGAMLELDPIFGDYAFAGFRSQTTFLVLAGLTYRL